MIDVGIVGVGTYLPEKTMKAAEIARLTNGVWSEDAVINKLGIKQRYLPGPDDGTQEMGAKAALKCLENTGVGVALELAAAEPQFVKAVFSIEGASHKGYPIFKKDEKGMPIVGSLYSSPDEMGEDPVQVKPVSLAFAAKNFQATDALWKATIYVVNKPSQKDNEILINETMKQVCLNELDWSLANINMSDSPNFYQKGDDTIKNVVCPCAFTSGELDMVVPRYMVMENVNAVKNSKLLAYEKCGHSPLVDCPDRLIKDITEFFA